LSDEHNTKLPQHRSHTTAGNQLCQPCEVLIHHAILLHGRAHRANHPMRRLPALRRPQHLRAAAIASMASTLRVFSTIRFSLIAAVMPMET